MPAFTSPPRKDGHRLMRALAAPVCAADRGALLAEFAHDTTIGPWLHPNRPALTWDELAQLRELLPHLTVADRFVVLLDLCRICERIQTIEDALNDRPTDTDRAALAVAETDLQTAADKAATR